MKAADEAVAEGANLYPQVGSRPLMLLIGHQTFHPFKFKPTYAKLKESLPWDEFIAELKKPEVKAAILEEEPEDEDPLMAFVFQGTERIFVLGDPPVYEPEESQSVRAIAESAGRDDEDVLYDLLASEQRQGILDGRGPELRRLQPRTALRRCLPIREASLASATAARTVAPFAMRPCAPSC